MQRDDIGVEYFCACHHVKIHAFLQNISKFVFIIRTKLICLIYNRFFININLIEEIIVFQFLDSQY